MKKILMSVAMLAFVGAVIAGATGAFFSDTETSTGNTFTAGAIDLKIDNESYAIDYTIPGYQSPTGALVLSTATSWELSDLTSQLFFNFVDLKPGDIGEDTISIHVNNNDAWMCMSTEITATPENGVTEPESQVDNQDNGSFDGELQDALNFVFWVDDGDNVLEQDEYDNGLWEGTAEEFMDTSPRIIADSTFNIFGENPGTPVPGDSKFYIAKAWCFGNLIPTPVPTDQGENPTVATGISCDGSELDNSTQTDGIEGNISFFAVQSRNNDEFVCEAPEPVEFVYDQQSAGDDQNIGDEHAHDNYNQPYVEWNYVPGGVELTFYNPTPWLFVFDVQVDGEAGVARDQTGSDLTSVEIPGGPLNPQLFGQTYQRIEVDGRPTPDVHQITQTFYGTNNIRVGLREGAENDWYIDWLTFNAS